MDLDEIEEDFQCTICKGIFKQTHYLVPCMHLFCKSCIEEALRKQTKPSCPQCRHPVPSRRSAKPDTSWDELVEAFFGTDVDEYEEQKMKRIMEMSRRNMATVLAAQKRQAVLWGDAGDQPAAAAGPSSKRRKTDAPVAFAPLEAEDASPAVRAPAYARLCALAPLQRSPVRWCGDSARALGLQENDQLAAAITSNQVDEETKDMMTLQLWPGRGMQGLKRYVVCIPGQATVYDVAVRVGFTAGCGPVGCCAVGAVPWKVVAFAPWGLCRSQLAMEEVIERGIELGGRGANDVEVEVDGNVPCNDVPSTIVDEVSGFARLTYHAA